MGNLCDTEQDEYKSMSPPEDRRRQLRSSPAKVFVDGCIQIFIKSYDRSLQMSFRD